MTERERINCVSITTFITVVLAMTGLGGTTLGFAYSVLDARINEGKQDSRVIERDVKDFSQDIAAIRVELATLRVVNENLLDVLSDLRDEIKNGQGQTK